jgi:hypothetical protein
MQKNKDKYLLIVYCGKKTSTFFDETIHITLGCAMHLHGHWNKVVLFMKPFILVDLNNGTKFRNCA